ncbi:adenylyltransferase/cytidyltransferase family protein [Candidatus Woesearchaeota archaeon]|nr:adenylyltransferase/cytidyltransferase family protein [Candidatus Woesearchaeota archaeon]
MTTVMVFGSFDVLHDGHRSLFRQARRLGDRLVVVVARDDTYRSLRGQEPLHDERERLRSVQDEPLVDEVLLGERKDVYRVLKRVRPDVVALGYDQTSFTEGLRGKLDSYGLKKTSIVRLESHSPGRFKSSLMKRAGGG